MLIKPRTLSGFKDRLPQDALRKEDIITTLMQTFRSFGYAPIETPHLEYAEILLNQGGEEIKKELYRFQDHGERDVALRFDLTVPLARFASQYKQELGLPFKRYAIGNVFRGERAQAGRYREFTQCDFDFIGSTSINSDAEIIQVIHDSLKALGIERFTISINNRKIMNGLCAHLGLESQTESLLRIIDKKDKIGDEKLKEELEKLEVGSEAVDSVLQFVAQNGTDRAFLEQVKSSAYNDLMREGIDELIHAFAILESCIDSDCLHFDFSIARGLGYYTGMVYETRLTDCPGIGSVSSGGRYDNLTQTFDKEPLPGVGASIGLDRLLAALDQLGDTPTTSTPATALLTLMDAAHAPEIYRIASQIRQAGIALETYPAPDKMKKQLSYANKKGFAYAIFAGESELESRTLTLKNLITGEQKEQVSLEVAITTLAEERS